LQTVPDPFRFAVGKVLNHANLYLVTLCVSTCAAFSLPDAAPVVTSDKLM
jgi:hypothetical protein